MAEVDMTITYLDGDGLKKLWKKISDTFLRDSEVVDALTNPGMIPGINSENDFFVQKKKLDEALAKVQGTNIDNETIVKNDDDKLQVNIDGTTIIKKENGELQTNLILVNDDENHILRIVTNKNDPEHTTVTYWDYTEFYQKAVKDGILESVSVVVVPSEGNPEAADRPAGTYLKFVFNTSSGKEPIYINVTDIVEVYEGDNYISVTTSTDEKPATISLKTTELVEYLKTDNALGITSLTSSVNTKFEEIEGQMSALEKLAVKLQSDVAKLQTDWGELNLDDLQDQVNDLTERVNKFTPIDLEDIEKLDESLSDETLQ